MVDSRGRIGVGSGGGMAYSQRMDGASLASRDAKTFPIQQWGDNSGPISAVVLTSSAKRCSDTLDWGSETAGDSSFWFLALSQTSKIGPQQAEHLEYRH